MNKLKAVFTAHQYNALREEFDALAKIYERLLSILEEKAPKTASLPASEKPAKQPSEKKQPASLPEQADKLE